MYFNYRGEESVVVTAGIWLSLALTLVSSADYCSGCDASLATRTSR